MLILLLIDDSAPSHQKTVRTSFDFVLSSFPKTYILQLPSFIAVATACCRLVCFLEFVLMLNKNDTTHCQYSIHTKIYYQFLPAEYFPWNARRRPNLYLLIGPVATPGHFREISKFLWRGSTLKNHIF